LQSQGCLTRSVLLPGHGTVPGGLLSASYPDWIQAVRYGIHSLSKAVDRIFLVGYSTGGALALHEALQTSDFYPQDKLAGIILLAPAVQIRSQLSRLAKIPLLLNGCWERARWLHIYNEIDYTKYQSITFNSVYQVSQLANLVETLSKNNAPCCPLLVMISQDDKTVSSNATLDYFKQHAPAQSQLVLYTTQPNAANNDSIIQRPAAYPEWNILNMSHIALPVAPDNPHYGRHGDYLYASRIEENPQQGKRYYGSYNDLQATLLDGLYHLGLSKSQKLKLTFNPDFEFLKQMLSEFLEKINSSKKQLL
jgi:esterase/lipase